MQWLSVIMVPISCIHFDLVSLRSCVSLCEQNKISDIWKTIALAFLKRLFFASLCCSLFLCASALPMHRSNATRASMHTRVWWCWEGSCHIEIFTTWNCLVSIAFMLWFLSCLGNRWSLFATFCFLSIFWRLFLFLKRLKIGSRAQRRGGQAAFFYCWVLVFMDKAG